MTDQGVTAGALAGLRVLDLTHVLAGPYCTWQFGMLGADVVKIEAPDEQDCARGRGPDGDPGAADGTGLTFRVQGTNKRSLLLDLRTRGGAEVFRDLAAGADVLVENRSAGWLDRLGLPLTDLRKANTRLVTCSITGYGAGPWGTVGAYDNTVQAASGVIAQSGGTKPGLSFIDYAVGHAAAFAIAAALVQRDRSGRGTHVDISMLEVAMGLMAPEAAATQSGHQPRPKEAGIRAYATAECMLMPGAFTPRQHRRLGEVLEDLGHPIPALADCIDWPTTWAAAEPVARSLTWVFGQRLADDWAALLRDKDLPAETVRPLVDALEHPALQARGAFAPDPRGEVPLPIGPWRMGEGGPSLTRPAPRAGEHTDEVLTELGLGPKRIAALRAAGAVA
ncbi:MAG: CaiB/BaiF CoA-transferase family protein [Pseudomonadota bacterium]